MSVATTQSGEITVHAGKINLSSDDFDGIVHLDTDDVLALTGAAAIKLTTPTALAFNDFTLPGADVRTAYSLWIKRSKQGWSLVFNKEADVWGTQRDPANDLGEAALAYSVEDEPVDELTPAIKVDGESGTLSIDWGTHRWTASFGLGPAESSF